MKILAYGEILWDIIEGTEHLGGAPFNFAAHSVKCGNEAYIVSRLGKDNLGERAYDQCKLYGVNSNLIQWDKEFPTGTVVVNLKNGQPDYLIRQEVAFDYIAPDPMILGENDLSFDVFYFGTLSQRNETSATTLRTVLKKLKFDHIFYDVNLRKYCYTKDIINQSLELCTIFNLNADELPIISEMFFGGTRNNRNFCDSLHSQFHNVNTIIITAGEKGCYISKDGLMNYVPGVPVSVLDAVGAGDAFSAAFMHVYSKRKNAIEAATIANQLGAFVTIQRGAIPEYNAEIRAILVT